MPGFIITWYGANIGGMASLIGSPLNLVYAVPARLKFLFLMAKIRIPDFFMHLLTKIYHLV